MRSDNQGERNIVDFKYRSLVVGIVSCILFAFICRIHLDAQGLYQDELFQATGSFTYSGKTPVAWLTIFVCRS